MANNYTPQSNDNLKAEADKYIADLSAQLSLLDNIHTSAATQKSQLANDGHELQKEAPCSTFTSKQLSSRLTKSKVVEKVDGEEVVTATVPVAHLELQQADVIQQKEFTPASLQARLADLEILVNGSEHEADRLRAAIAARDPRNTEMTTGEKTAGFQFDFRLPQIEFGTLKRTLQSPT